MAEKVNPTTLAVGNDLYRNCELGLDEEEISYVIETHGLQIRIGGEPFYLFVRTDTGTTISKSITSWETTSPQYSAYIWVPSDGENFHPNSRSQQDTFKVFDDTVEMTRVFDKASIVYDTEYALEVLSGGSATDKRSVKIWFNTGMVPGAIALNYRAICSCVDDSTGYPNRECVLCRGTSYPAAFVQYICSATKYFPENTVLIRVPLAGEAKPVEQIGRVTTRDLHHWMEASPIVNNYDLILGTTGRNSGVLFEIVQKHDSRWRGLLTHQQFDTVRIEEDDVRYTLAPLSVKAIIEETISITSNAVIV